MTEFFERATWAPPVREVWPKGVLGWLMRLSPVRVFENDPDAIPPSDYNPENDRPHCDLEGTWHGLHFLFTGTAWEGDEPSCYLLRGGEDIGDADELGYSVLHALSPAKAIQFAGFLRSLSREMLGRRFDSRRMTELAIYPGGWEHTSRSDDSRYEHLLSSYEDLRSFVDGTVETKSGLVVYVT